MRKSKLLPLVLTAVAAVSFSQIAASQVDIRGRGVQGDLSIGDVNNSQTIGNNNQTTQQQGTGNQSTQQSGTANQSATGQSTTGSPGSSAGASGSVAGPTD